jgi:flagellar assembly protein FliH
MGRIVKAGAAREASTTTEAAVASLAQARAEVMATAIPLARKMAEKIIGHAVAVDAAVMRDIAAQALAAAKPGGQAVLLRVHPEDLASIASARAEWLAELGLKAGVKLVGDEAVGRFGCIVETPRGRLDARLETQLDALERALRRGETGRA